MWEKCVYGPGYIQDNLSVFKTFAIWESVSLEAVSTLSS